MRNLKIRFIKIDNKYTMEFKRFGLWVKAMVPIGGSHMEKIIYGIVLASTPSKCLNKYLYSKNKSKVDYRITEYPTIKKY
tara:strand:- start:364 stop:603 length:240 start_codon:yes stop_codon:yes gene_type:complete